MNTKNAWITLIGLCVVCFLGCIDFTIVNTALPAIQSELNISISALQWVINSFLLVLSALMVIAGRLGDIYGRRRVLYCGMVLFALSSLGAGLASSVAWLIFFRSVQGAAIAVLYTVPVAIIPNIFPEHLHGKATGILFGVNGFGLAVGPVIGGLILSVLSWRWIFFVNLPLIILGFLFLIRNLPETFSHDHGNKIDWTGFVLLLIALPCSILALIQGTQWGWLSATNIALYVISALAFFAFYRVEKRVESPIISFHLLKNSHFIFGLIANFSLAFFYTVDFFLLPLYLHNLKDASGFFIGLFLLPATLLVALISPMIGGWVAKVGPRRFLCIGFTAFAISAILQALFVASSSPIYIVVSLLFMGLGWSFILTPSMIAAISSVPQSASGVAMGTVGTLHNFGGSIGLALGVIVYHYRAKVAAIADLGTQHAGTWLDKAIADPDNALSLITHNTNLAASKAKAIFANFFMHGFSGAMVLLAVVSILALLVVFFGLKKQAA